jgi:PEP-CTERM motif
MVRSVRIPRPSAILLGMVAFCVSMQSAQATMTSLEVTLRDPENFSPELFDPPGPNSGTDGFVDTVSVGAGKEIYAGNTTHIGGATIGGSTLLLANEYVDADPNPISGTSCSVLGAICVYRVVLGLEAGAGDQTGYGATAFYAFSNFAFSTNSQVLGVSMDTIGISGLGALSTKQARVTVVNGVITVPIGTLTMPSPLCPGDVVCGQVLLNLTVQAVPEPATYALIGAGLGLLTVVRRRRQNS